MSRSKLARSSRDYRVNRETAAAIHNDDATADGILYVSNRHNVHLAAALFERSGVTTLQAPGVYVPLSAHPDYRASPGCVRCGCGVATRSVTRLGQSKVWLLIRVDNRYTFSYCVCIECVDTRRARYA